MRIFCPATLILFLAFPLSHTRFFRGVKRWKLASRFLYNVVRARGLGATPVVLTAMTTKKCSAWQNRHRLLFGVQDPKSIQATQGRFSRITRGNPNRFTILPLFICHAPSPVLILGMSLLKRGPSPILRPSLAPAGAGPMRKRHVRLTSVSVFLLPTGSPAVVSYRGPSFNPEDTLPC